MNITWDSSAASRRLARPYCPRRLPLIKTSAVAAYGDSTTSVSGLNCSIRQWYQFILLAILRCAAETWHAAEGLVARAESRHLDKGCRHRWRHCAVDIRSI